MLLRPAWSGILSYAVTKRAARSSLFSHHDSSGQDKQRKTQFSPPSAGPWVGRPLLARRDPRWFTGHRLPRGILGLPSRGPLSKHGGRFKIHLGFSSWGAALRCPAWAPAGAPKTRYGVTGNLTQFCFSFLAHLPAPASRVRVPIGVPSLGTRNRALRL